ncbi:MAG: N-acetylmuramoyl-L-alanine amidase [Firmicutes bacterium]|nr:N-acetylmuramoyl-L-alanine amidase [Bacillota bacterium]
MAIKGIVFHWTAGRYDQTFSDYHYNVTFEPQSGRANIVKTCSSDDDKKHHTWNRNNERIGISLCCAYQATSANLGNYPPTDAQIEAAAALAGKLAHIYSIKEDEIKTHAEWAFVDGYGPGSGDPETRWDLWIPNWKGKGKNLSQVIRDKSLWYKEQFKGHTEDHNELFAPKTINLANHGEVYLPSIVKTVMEAHLVTSDEPGMNGSWPTSFEDRITSHYNHSEAATGHKMRRAEPWCPSNEGGSNEFGQGSSVKPPAVAEAWYMCMYWKNPPLPGTKMIMRNPANGKTVVAAAGYEIGPGSPQDCLAGACEEIHHYLGTKHTGKIEIGFAKDQSLPYGPLEIKN